MHDMWRLSPVSSLKPRDLLLVTDFDGTLAEIAPDPTEAHILPASLAAVLIFQLAGLWIFDPVQQSIAMALAVAATGLLCRKGVSS